MTRYHYTEVFPSDFIPALLCPSIMTRRQGLSASFSAAGLESVIFVSQALIRCRGKPDYGFKGRKFTAAKFPQISASGFSRNKNFGHTHLISVGFDFLYLEWGKGQIPGLLAFRAIHCGQAMCCVLSMLDYLKFKPVLTEQEENLLPKYTISQGNPPKDAVNRVIWFSISKSVFCVLLYFPHILTVLDLHKKHIFK